MTSPKQRLDAHGISPKKSLGQNYIHDENTLARIIESAAIPPNATILEIGPGLGALSVGLAKIAQRLILIETDQRVKPILEAELDPFPNVEYYWEDFLESDLSQILGDEPYHVVANLPYYITSAIIRKLLDNSNRPQSLVLTVQKEVAERIIAKPGKMSILSVSVQLYGQASMVMTLNPGVFWPRPDVSSAVIKIDCYPEIPYNISNTKRFFQIVKAGFGQKRKQLKNALNKGLPLNSEQISALFTLSGIDPQRRAETLSIEEWSHLHHAMAEVLKD